MLTLKGNAQVLRCIHCMRTGEWLLAADDIEETEVLLMEQGAHDILAHGSEAIDIVRPSTGDGRSEEHTSELQSLMRISYAVFCLKKTKPHYTNKHNHKKKRDMQKRRK